MRRINITGLCLVALLALVATFALSAEAKKSKGLITGPWETTSTTGAVSLHAGLATVTCNKGTDVGKVTGAKSDEETLTLSECALEGKKCTTTGQSAGTIKTENLATELGWIDKAKGEVGVDFKPAGKLVEFECEGVTAKVSGSVIGVVAPTNIETETTATTFAEASGKQAVEKFEGGSADVLKAAVGGGPEAEAVQTGVDTVHNNEVIVKKGKKAEVKMKDPTEIYTTGGTPEYGRCQPNSKGIYKDSNCTEKAAEHKGKPKGKFEFEAA